MEQDAHFTIQDRKTLTQVETKLDRAIDDIKNLTNNFAQKSEVSAMKEDYEARLRTLEKESEDHALVKKVVYSAIGFILISVLGSLIYLVIK